MSIWLERCAFNIIKIIYLWVELRMQWSRNWFTLWKVLRWVENTNLQNVLTCFSSWYKRTNQNQCVIAATTTTSSGSSSQSSDAYCIRYLRIYWKINSKLKLITENEWNQCLAHYIVRIISSSMHITQTHWHIRLNSQILYNGNGFLMCP